MKRLATVLLLLNIVFPAQAGVVIWDSGIVAQKVEEHQDSISEATRATKSEKTAPRATAAEGSWLTELLSSLLSHHERAGR